MIRAYARIFTRSVSMSGAEILVSGATGRTGGAAIAELLKMGRHVRAYVRSDGEQASALRKQGVEIALGDFTDIDAIRAAMEGIRSAYFLYPIAPGILGAAAYFAEAAKEAGVTAIVNMSQISARRESASHAAQDHWLSERIFDWSGVPTTHLRPTFFAEWLVYPHFAKEIWATKRIESPSQTVGMRPSPARIRDVSSPISWPIPRVTRGRSTGSMARSR
jgi:NAD(P)H dehydrogenase (quinone)